jgi:predicted P-loop ATPase
VALDLEDDPRINSIYDETVYDYTDAHGNLLFQVVIKRFPNGEKKTRQRRPNPTQLGEFINNIEGIERVLYRLQDVLKSLGSGEPILIVEGEKCVLAAEKLGFVATTNPGGALKWRGEYSETLRGAHVVILPDNDDPGRKHADQVKRSLRGVAASVVEVELPNLPEKGDIADWIASGGTKEQLDELIDNASIITATSSKVKGKQASELRGEYQQTDGGAYRESQANYEILLSQEPRWQGRLRYNEFLHAIELDGRPISTQDRSAISSWASHNLKISGGRVIIRDQAIEVIASKSLYDPLQEYIHSLPAWDKQERLLHLFEMYYGVEPSDYTQWCGRMLFTHMIARALEPGCPGRYVVVLCGPQNIGKSETVRVLGGEWATELSSDLDSRDSQMQLKGAWLVELGELNSIRKSHVEAVNRFISARFDEYIPKYANDPVRYPRRCVFIGTSNRDDFLRDPTGLTRWFPITVSKADYEGLARDRDLLFAEAKLWHDLHKNDWWMIPTAVMQVLEQVREESREVGPYEERLVEWLRDTGRTSTTWLEIAKFCLELPEGQWKSVQMSVSDSLKAMGWTSKQVRSVPGSRAKERRWFAPAVPQPGPNLPQPLVIGWGSERC